jgi:hypothetical protein
VLTRFLPKGEPVPQWIFYLGGATPLVVFGLLVFVFDRFAWHWSALKPLYAMVRSKAPPYIHGRYAGKITWHDQTSNSQNDSHVCVNIVQRWQTLVVSFTFTDEAGNKRAESHSNMAFISQGLDDDKPTLQYTYAYEGTETAPTGRIRTNRIHGTAVHDFERDGKKWKIAGRYYSDDMGTGMIILEQTS